MAQSPTITSFTINKKADYFGKPVTLSWNVAAASNIKIYRVVYPTGSLSQPQEELIYNGASPSGSVNTTLPTKSTDPPSTSSAKAGFSAKFILRAYNSTGVSERVVRCVSLDPNYAKTFTTFAQLIPIESDFVGLGSHFYYNEPCVFYYGVYCYGVNYGAVSEIKVKASNTDPSDSGMSAGIDVVYQQTFNPYKYPTDDEGPADDNLIYRNFIIFDGVSNSYTPRHRYIVFRAGIMFPGYLYPAYNVVYISRFDGVPSPEPPVIDLFIANPNAGLPGYKATLSWKISKYNNYFASGTRKIELWSNVTNIWGGTGLITSQIGSEGSFTIDVPQAQNIELRVTHPYGNVSSYAPLTIADPVTVSASLSQTSLYGPGTVTLTWSSQNATSVTINGNPVALSGSQQIVISNKNQAGTMTFTVVATGIVSGQTMTDTKTVTLTVTWPPDLQITTESPLPAANNVESYSQQLQGTGGFGDPANYTWQLVSGSLPPGLSLSPSGLISGTPFFGSGQAGNYSFRIRLSDDGLDPAEKDFVIPAVYIQPLDVQLSSSTVALNQETPLSLTATANGGFEPITWSLIGAPAWMSSSPSGRTLSISGQPSGNQANSWTVTVRAVCNVPNSSIVLSDEKQFTVNYSYLPLSWTAPSLTEARKNSPTSVQFSAAHGTPPYHWTVVSAPQGLTISSTGLLSWTPDAVGTYQFRVQVSDAYDTLYQDYTVQVYRAWDEIDPFHQIFYQVYEGDGSTAVPGMTNDGYPQGQKVPFARIAVGFTVGERDILFEDARQRGGGLHPDFWSVPEADHFADIGFLDGRPYPASGACVAYFPKEILERLSRAQIEEAVRRSAPLAAAVIVRFYSRNGEESV